MITLKQHDTARKIQQRLTVDGAVLDLTGAEVSVLWRRVGDTTVLTRTAAAVAPYTSGIVEYQPVADDVDTPGDFEIEWKIQYPDTRMTIPTRERVRVKIYPALA